jgi:multidrug efflux pump subunit AcrA (membrane-fusion protein)
MEIDAPKSGFIVKILVKDGSHVDAGTPLILMDSDWEDRYLRYLEVNDRMREARTAKYRAEQLRLAREANRIAAGTSEAQVKDAQEQLEQFSKAAKKWSDDQGAYLMKLKARLLIAAPINGTIKLLIAEDCFARYGHTIAEVV